MRWYHIVLGLSFLGGCFACGIDFDHIPLWIFGLSLEWWFPNLLWPIACEGRNLHSLYFWIPIAIIIAGVCSPFLARLVKKHVHK